MWDRFPTYLPIYISYIHVHALHNADLPIFPRFPLVAENLHDTVCLRVGRRIAVVDYHIECCETLYYLAEEVSSLIAYEFDRTTVPITYVFIQKTLLMSRCCLVVLSLPPILCSSLFPVRIAGDLNGPMKSNPHF